MVSPESRPQLSCSAASSVRSWPGQSLAWLRLVLRPFALPGFPRASSLLRPLLTSHGLSTKGSPRVSACSFRSRRWALQTAVSDSRASCSLAHSPPTACLTAHSCSCGRTFACRPFAPAPCGDDLAVRLRLASLPPSGTFHPDRPDPCRAHKQRQVATWSAARENGPKQRDATTTVTLPD